MIELTYIYHDCFVAVTPQAVMVFDYWKYPDAQVADAAPDFISEVCEGKPIYVFVSHFHKDHFNKAIFNWIGVHSPIHFIISKDTARHIRYILNPGSNYMGVRPTPEQVTILGKLEQYSDDCIRVKAFGSTDIGNSYAVELLHEGITLFHAGDLNCWAWRDESTPEEIENAETAFRRELSSIAEDYPHLDIAMFPVDCRIGTQYAQGAREFLQSINVSHFFPMHFGLGDTPEETDIYRRGALAIDEYAAGEGEIIVLSHFGDRFRKLS